MLYMVQIVQMVDVFFYCLNGLIGVNCLYRFNGLNGLINNNNNNNNKWIYLSNDVVQKKSKLTSISAMYDHPGL